MLIYPHINPIALSLGPIAVHWYGVMYLCGFASGWALGSYRARQAASGWTSDEVGDVIFYAAMGVILGGRLGYVLFYEPQRALADPLWIFRVWEGGMSFHGGMLGVFFAMWLFGKNTKRVFFQITDFIAPLVPPGLFFGRIGNFIGGELWGRPVTDTHLPWAMIYPHVDNLPRHPSELYEAGAEGILLFILLWWFSSRPRPRMAVSALFLIGYGTARFCMEFFREPDADQGYILLGWMTKGQMLSAPMILAGILLMVVAYRKKAAA
ncbi:MAG: prolipoprotein diacylglyceryl transferase [Pseudomonadales bacterium]|nr:prolipoprotein diacylglyceryl transferase [Pseudomonadales bacterium]